MHADYPFTNVVTIEVPPGVIVALQEAADIPLHIASDEGWGVPPS